MQKTHTIALWTGSPILLFSDPLTQPGGLQALAPGFATRQALLRALRAWEMTKEQRIRKSAGWRKRLLGLLATRFARSQGARPPLAEAALPASDGRRTPVAAAAPRGPRGSRLAFRSDRPCRVSAPRAFPWARVPNADARALPCFRAGPALYLRSCKRETARTCASRPASCRPASPPAPAPRPQPRVRRARPPACAPTLLPERLWRIRSRATQLARPGAPSSRERSSPEQGEGKGGKNATNVSEEYGT